MAPPYIKTELVVIVIIIYRYITGITCAISYIRYLSCAAYLYTSACSSK